MRRAGGHDDGLAHERTRGGRKQAFDCRDDCQRLAHAAHAGLTLFCHLALFRAGEGDAVFFQHGAVAARGRIVPHGRVHGRRDQNRHFPRQQHGAGEIVGEAVRHLGHQVGGSGRDDDQVRLAGEPDMADILLVLA